MSRKRDAPRKAPSEPRPPQAGILDSPIDAIRPRADQPRRTFADESLDELAASIREQGVVSPLLVRRTKSG